MKKSKNILKPNTFLKVDNKLGFYSGGGWIHCQHCTYLKQGRSNFANHILLDKCPD